MAAHPFDIAIFLVQVPTQLVCSFVGMLEQLGIFPDLIDDLSHLHLDKTVDHFSQGIITFTEVIHNASEKFKVMSAAEIGAQFASECIATNKLIGALGKFAAVANQQRLKIIDKVARGQVLVSNEALMAKVAAGGVDLSLNAGQPWKGNTLKEVLND